MKGMFCKRFIALVTMLTLVCSMLLPYSNASAETGSALHIEAGAAILFEADTGKILYEKNPDELLSIASMTKIMIVYFVFEAVDEGKFTWDPKVKVSEYAYKVSRDASFSNVAFENGGSYTVRELYDSMVIFSANGSSIALAELIAGKEVDFLKMMNDKAKELGLKNYKFVNSTGLTNTDLKGMHPEGTTADEENKISAKDVGSLAQHLIKDYPKVLDTAKIPKKEFRPEKEKFAMSNWNWMLKGLVKEYDGVDGLKTGSTPEAGDCFTGTVERNGMRFISVVINTSSHTARFDETKKLYDYGFANFEMKQMYKKGSSVKGQEKVLVENAKDKDVAVQTKQAISLPVPKGSKEVYKTELKESSKGQEAPIKKGAALGQMVITPKDTNDPGFLTGKSLQVDLVTTSEVEEANWFTRAMRGIGSFFSGIWNSAVDTVKGWF
ncbi:D-alanyl-D-alanine carboxypeptidase [Bacillus anthracis]|nr:D-alanyl-D-alanine carboxypeptidase [Bacillus anthracis]